jgi:hypothetical protein
MTKRTATLVSLVLAAVICTVASVALAGVAADRKSGACKLQQCGAFDDAKQFKFKFGKVLKAECEWRLDDFFGKNTAFVGATIKNPTEKPMFFQYSVALFDAKGNLIGATSQSSFGDDGLAGGDETQLGSCLIMLPKAAAKQIAKYQVVLYESDKPIGKE